MHAGQHAYVRSDVKAMIFLFFLSKIIFSFSPSIFWFIFIDLLPYPYIFTGREVMIFETWKTCSDTDSHWETITESWHDSDEYSEEMEKVSFICSCALATIRDGGSVLIPIGRLGVMLQLLENISLSLESSNLKVCCRIACLCTYTNYSTSE